MVAATVQSKVDGCRVEKFITERNYASLSLRAVAIRRFANDDYMVTGMPNVKCCDTKATAVSDGVRRTAPDRFSGLAEIDPVTGTVAAIVSLLRARAFAL